MFDIKGLTTEEVLNNRKKENYYTKLNYRIIK